MENNKAQTNGNYIAFTSGDPMSLTKREYFAGLAMQGMLANPYYAQMIVEKLPADEAAKFLSDACVEQTDALLTALESPNGIKK